MREKSVLKNCGHIFVFSFLWDTFGEEIKKLKPQTYDHQNADGKNHTIPVVASINLNITYS